MTQRAYNVWTAREVEALKRGVQVHGVGFWEQIRNDPQFEVLRGRTGVQLKDKWRNLVKFQKPVANAVPEPPAGPSHSGSGARPRRPRARMPATRSPKDGILTPVKVEEAVEEPSEDWGAEYASALAASAVASALASAQPESEAFASAARLAQEALAAARARVLEGGADGGAGGRVIEDRRYGIYDVRRYVHASGSGGSGAKRAHATSDSGSDEPGGGKRPGSRRRLRRRAPEEEDDPAQRGPGARCHGCGVSLGPGGALRAGRYAYLCAECEPASLFPPGGSGSLPAGPGAEDHVGRVLSAARQLSVEGGLDRFGSMNDSLVLDIAQFMEVLPLTSLTPRKADGEGPASPAALGDGRQPLSPLPVWGNKRTRRQRHGQEGGLRGASGDEEGPGEEEHRRSATDSAVRQLAAALPPELALPPGALLEMYHSLGGDAGGRAPAVDSVAMAMRRRGVAMHDRAGPFEEGSPAARGHAFQPVPQLRLLRGDSRSPTPPLPDAAVTPPAELMGSAAQAYARGAAPAQARGLAEGGYHAAPVWPAAPPPYGFHRALAPPENGGGLGAGTRYLPAGRPDEGLLIEALKAGLGGEAARDLARDAAALDEGLAGPVRLQTDRGAYGGGRAALLLGARAEAGALPRPGGGSPPVFGARPGVWGPEPGVGPGPGAQRRDAGVVAPPSPALAQEAVAAVMAAMTAWS